MKARRERRNESIYALNQLFKERPDIDSLKKFIPQQQMVKKKKKIIFFIFVV